MFNKELYNKPYHDIDLSKYSFLITGGAGFIGSNLVEYLLRYNAGYVRVLDNLSNGYYENIQDFIGLPNFEFLEGDIRNLETCKMAVEGVNFISHQAALGSVPRSIADPITSNEVNIGGFLNMLSAAKDSPVLKKMVYAASSSTYGDSAKLPKIEGNEGSPLSPYAVTKLVNELYADVFSRVYGFNTIGLRYFNIFGPKQNPDNPYAAVVPIFCQAFLDGLPPLINGDGETSRDFTFVENAIQANIRALFANGFSKHEVFNVACGDQISLNEMVFHLQTISLKDIKAQYGPERVGDVRHSKACISKIKNLLDYKPNISFKDGLQKVFQWYKEKKIKMKDKTVLITGGTGSLGKALTGHIFKNFPEVKKVIIFSRDEQKQFQMAQEFPENKFPQIRFFLGDVRDEQRLIRAFQDVDIVIHAAAMKHVHLAEYNPDECIKTNIGGAQNVIRAALQCGVSNVVALSTDKACAPINLYGATKLTSDKLFVAANNIRGSNPIKFSVVRYGNVMGSNGSVIPFFLKKKKEGKLPITDSGMTRFNITLQGGVDMVMHAINNAWGGEIFIPKIPSYRITDVATAVAPECKQVIIGIRPGEKIHEEMITSSDSFYTYDLGKYYTILPSVPNFNINDFITSFGAKKVAEGFSYDSGTNAEWETIESLRILIKEHVDLNFE